MTRVQEPTVITAPGQNDPALILEYVPGQISPLQVQRARGSSVFETPPTTPLTPVGLIGPFDPRLASTSFGTAANEARICRVISPKSGTLSALAVYVTAQSGNMDLGVFTTQAPNRTRLWSAGSTPVGAINNWQVFAPNIPLAMGEQYDFAVAFDNAVATIASAAASTIFGNQGLPPGWCVPNGGAKNQLFGALAAAFPLPATMSDAAISGSGRTICILGLMV